MYHQIFIIDIIIRHKDPTKNYKLLVVAFI